MLLDFLIEKQGTKLGNLFFFLKNLWAKNPRARVMIFSQVCIRPSPLSPLSSLSPLTPLSPLSPLSRTSLLYFQYKSVLEKIYDVFEQRLVPTAFVVGYIPSSSLPSPSPHSSLPQLLFSSLSPYLPLPPSLSLALLTARRNVLRKKSELSTIDKQDYHTMKV